MSSPENPLFSAPPSEPNTLDRNVPPDAIDAGIEERFPAWGWLDLLLVLVVLVVSMVACQVIALMVASSLPGFNAIKPSQIAEFPLVIVSSMAAGYLVTLGFVYRMLAIQHRVGFFDGLHWRWPGNWGLYLILGIALSVAIQGATNLLPIPKDLPIDSYFKSTIGAWAMALFGTLIAPFAEEVLFRGLLFPVLRRNLGVVTGVILTSAAFALVHASQLRSAWSPVLMVFMVGVALTLVRSFTRSLAASVLVHTAYNGTIFAIVLYQTHWFQHMERLR